MKMIFLKNEGYSYQDGGQEYDGKMDAPVEKISKNWYNLFEGLREKWIRHCT